MRPEISTIRVVATLCLVAACAASGQPSGTGTQTGAAGSGGPTAGAAGAGQSSGSAGAAGAVTGSGAAGASTGAAGATGVTGGAGTAPWGGGGTVDQGLLFTDAAVVSTEPADAGATGADTGSMTGSTTPGDGNTSTCHIGGMNYVLVFTQKGADVTMVVTANNCPAGSHTIQIHAGFSCDNAGTEGGVWDNARGAGIPMLTCANNKGTLTYTRSGADPTANWTVGDHSTKTDVTLHPMSVDTNCGTFF